MDDTPATARLTAFDPSLVSAEGLAELFPDLGLFPAEDIVDWRGKHDGAFPDAETLAASLGIDGPLAARITEAAGRHGIVEVTEQIASVDDIESDGDHETAETSVATAVSEATLPAASPAPSAPPVRTAPPPLPVPASTPSRLLRVHYVVAGLFVLNAALVAGAVRLHLETKRTRAPIAAMSAEVSELRADQAGVQMKFEEGRAQLDETRIRLDETRARLDEQAHLLAATAQRQKDDEHEAREHEAREARELAALSARVSRTDRHTYKLAEAIKLIDMVQGHAAPAPPGERVVPIVNP